MSALKFDEVMDTVLRQYEDQLLIEQFWIPQIRPRFSARMTGGAVWGQRADWTTLMCEGRLRDDGLDQALALDYRRRVDEVRAFASALAVDVADVCDHDHL